MEVSMNEDRKKTQGKPRCWVGLDWGGQTHAVSIVDEKRTLLEQFTVGADLDGLRQLGARLQARGSVAGVAIEATHNMVVEYLSVNDFTVYLINPKLSKNWREGTSVAGVKNDTRDGWVLAVELARRHEELRPRQGCDPEVAQWAGLCVQLRALIDQRTSLVQRLKETLRRYDPGAAAFFSDWTSPVAWRFLQRFPNPPALARAHKSTLIRFLKANRIGLTPTWLERIEARAEATRWPSPPDALAIEVLALATVAQLLALQSHIDKCERLIAQCSAQRSEVGLLRSLPGAGERLAPALAAMAAVASAEGADREALRCLSGVAPVEEQSGKRHRIRARRRCNKHWRDILHLFAHCSTVYCKWAKAFYDVHRERGDRHATALRKLADKWLKIICRMLATGEPYDEQRYLDALRKKGSPVYQRLCGQAGG
jgi:transposase